MLKVNDFIKFLKGKVGTNYVYGAKGTVLTMSQFTQLYNMYGSPKIPRTDVEKVGTVCVDCSGLMQWFSGVKLNSSGLASNAIKTGTNFDNVPLGATLWRRGHVGFYIGDGKFIEAKGSRYGTIVSELSKTNFSKWCLQSFIDYNTEDETETEEPKEPDETEIYTVIKGDNLTKISRIYECTIDELVIMNKIKYPDIKPNFIRIGWKLIVPKLSKNKSHIVVKGDTLGKLAKQYNTSIDKIVNDNKSIYPKITRSHIQIGWVLWV